MALCQALKGCSIAKARACVVILVIYYYMEWLTDPQPYLYYFNLKDCRLRDWTSSYLIAVQSKTAGIAYSEQPSLVVSNYIHLMIIEMLDQKEVKKKLRKTQAYYKTFIYLTRFHI